MKTRAWIFRVLLLLYIAAVAYLCFANFKNLPNVSRHLWGFETDKLVHFLMFFPFPALAFFSIARLPSGIWGSLLRVLGIFCLGCIFAAATELIQERLVYRSCDTRDFKADMLAMIICSCAVYLSHSIIRIRKKRTTEEP